MRRNSSRHANSPGLVVLLRRMSEAIAQKRRLKRQIKTRKKKMAGVSCHHVPLQISA
jgi:hypothetical protein